MLSDTIVALATPPGRSAIAVVRLSGSDAFTIGGRVIEGFRAAPARRVTLATFHTADGTSIDRGLYTTFPAPASYTGEDMIELSCHGGLVVPVQLVAALQAAGARPASPGEFTRRAVLNGKLDLLQAEAVADLIDATATVQARAALAQLDGGLSRRLVELRERLLDVEALLGYEIDFPGEDDGPVASSTIADTLAVAADRVRRLLASAPAGERLREGALVVLAGRPNVGKSSLFNALLGQERALVTEVAGTTRDAIEAHTEFQGWPVRLADTAGLRAVDDPVERLGVAVSHRWLAAADLILLCAEAGRLLGADEEQLAAEGSVLVVRTKADLAPDGGGGLAVSAITGEGLDRLRRVAGDRLFGHRLQLADLEPALTRARHVEALRRALAALHDAEPHLTSGGDPVLAAHHVREGVRALDELIGVVDVEEVLGRIFAGFCIGK
ncbi:MAG TPA: tRNA uridine-5-carboxymethylaminomethyl(34) synthesis GTPase MnmE [Gemmatimonadales bacterium]|nr:tRNA uridine-5-carboxymethylaminomethyl(34) synthesis GTPase MnmE [Gemmatimonadales bacterium]